MEIEPTKLAELTGYSSDLDVGDERGEDSWTCPRFLAEK